MIRTIEGMTALEYAVLGCKRDHYAWSCQVAPDGAVSVYDDVAEAVTSCHSIPETVQARIRAAALGEPFVAVPGVAPGHDPRFASGRRLYAWAPKAQALVPYADPMGRYDTDGRYLTGSRAWG